MKALIVALSFYSGMVLAQAGPHPEPAVAAVECSWLLTEAECQQHRQVLAGLSEPAARLDYLERHVALLREREAMCGCRAGRQVLARAHYR